MNVTLVLDIQGLKEKKTEEAFYFMSLYLYTLHWFAAPAAAFPYDYPQQPGTPSLAGGGCYEHGRVGKRMLAVTLTTNFSKTGQLRSN